MIDTAAAESFATRSDIGRIIVIDGAKHEILIERDVFRRQFWAAFDKFVPGSAARAALPGDGVTGAGQAVAPD